MDRRLKELAEQVGLITNQDIEENNYEYMNDLERFAQLVRQDEREANVKLLEDFAKTNMVPAKDTWRMGVMAAANAVRDKK